VTSEADPPLVAIPRRWSVVAVLVLVAALALWRMVVVSPVVGWPLVAALAAAGLGGLVWWQRPGPRLRRRLGRRGWLGVRQWWGEAGPWAARRHARTRAPLTGVDRDPRSWRVRWSARYGLRVGRVVSGRWPVRGLPVCSPWSRGVCVVGPPGSGKSSWLVGPILDAPGAAYVSSTKTELVELTGLLRAARGPVQVFNPTGLGGVASTFGWDPLSGCVDPAVADARARALVRGGGGASGAQAEFWAAKAAEIVRCYLLAAAVSGQSMTAVMEWALDPDDDTPLTMLDALAARESAAVPEGWVGTFERNLHAAPNERSGYMAAVLPAVTFVDNPLVAAACRPPAGQALDLAAFLAGPAPTAGAGAEAGTVYVIAGDDRRIAALVTALTEAVFDTAKRVAAAQGGRLAVPLTMLLDEVANTTPVPLDNWAADSRGWGITLVAVLQDLAQAHSRWGATRAQTVLANLPVKVVLPGLSEPRDLDALAYLGGTRRVRQTSESVSDGRGSRSRSRQRSWAREPVVTGQLIYALPRWHAYVLGLGPAPVIVRFTPGWRVAGRARSRLACRGWQPAPIPRLVAVGSPPATVTPLRPPARDRVTARNAG